MDANQALDRFGTLSRLMNVGVLLLDTTVDIEFANSIACELLGAADVGGAKLRWADIKQRAQLDPERVAGSPSPMRLVTDVGRKEAARSLRLEIHTLKHRECEGYLVLLRDRRSVDALEANLLLASQMRSVVHFHRALAHDLRAPLNSMQLTLDLLTADADGVKQEARPDSRGRYMAILYEELTRLNDIVRSALDRPEPLDLIPQEFDLRELLRETARLVGPQARRQRVNIDLRLPDRAAIMSGYRDRIKQALINLALDGIDGVPGGGGLAVSLEVRGAVAAITIGKGSAASGTFDDIYRIHPAGGQGDGAIGLYVARLIVESHGGEFATGGAGGARFDLTLPLGGQPVATEKAAMLHGRAAPAAGRGI